MRIQLENVNSIRKCKFNLKMEKSLFRNWKESLEIYLTKIEEYRKVKKKCFVRLRDELTVKINALYITNKGLSNMI